MIEEPVINHSLQWGWASLNTLFISCILQNDSSHFSIGNCCDTLLGKQPMPDALDHIEVYL